VLELNLKWGSLLEVGTMPLARGTTKGQVTIPAEVRRALDIGEGDDLLFEVVEAGEARIRALKRRRLSNLYRALPATRP